jgi:uncharacterized membrane protein AbrB (regulator of aidB expression)
MTRITWIIIFLIVISICITCLEVLIRFAMLHGRGVGVAVSDMRKQVIPGPTLLFGRAVVAIGRGVHGKFSGR